MVIKEQGKAGRWSDYQRRGLGARRTLCSAPRSASRPSGSERTPRRMSGYLEAHEEMCQNEKGALRAACCASTRRPSLLMRVDSEAPSWPSNSGGPDLGAFQMCQAITRTFGTQIFARRGRRIHLFCSLLGWGRYIIPHVSGLELHALELVVEARPPRAAVELSRAAVGRRSAPGEADPSYRGRQILVPSPSHDDIKSKQADTIEKFDRLNGKQ